MRFLVIGLGSMGKRRVRCLLALNHLNIIAYDSRPDRRQETSEKYNIEVVEQLDDKLLSSVDVYIISTPPNKHDEYLSLAIKHRKPCFVEGSVLIDKLPKINLEAKTNGIFIAPSCTLKFHPIIKEIKRIISSYQIGKVTNLSYHSGQYLPDWHPWEKVEDYYVSNRATGGGREIVPFELTWINDVFGEIEEIKGFFKKTIDFGSQIEDTYAFTIRMKDALGSIIVDVASRYATRNLIVNLEHGQLLWNWNEGKLHIFDVRTNRWSSYIQPEGNNADGYNKNIIEEMYIDEIYAFIEGIKDPNTYPSSLEEDIKILTLLNSIETSDGGFIR